LKTNRYLGIDESRFGKDPEIYVAVFSDQMIDITKRDEELPKKRGRSNVAAASNWVDYRHILVSHSSIEQYGLKLVRAAIFSRFIEDYFNLRGELELVIIDGHVRGHELDIVREILDPIPMPDIRGEVKADSKYPIVNSADHIANQLGRYYSNIAEITSRDERKQCELKFKGTLLEVPLDEYLIKLFEDDKAK